MCANEFETKEKQKLTPPASSRHPPPPQRVLTACSRFYMYACISSLLTKPELRREIGAIDVNQRFFGY